MKDIDLIIVRGAGDLASGIIHRLFRAGYPVLVLETDRPAAIRRQVSFCEAVYDGTATVEGVTARKIDTGCLDSIRRVLASGEVPVLVDPKAESVARLHPDIVIDAIIAKRNLGTNIKMAPLTIAIGPGFSAGTDVTAVVESMRGHNLGRIITEGTALDNTGIPGSICGFTRERVIHSPASGILKSVAGIGASVVKGDIIAEVVAENGTIPVTASISGIVRGLIRDGYAVSEGLKICDIDPRETEIENCFTISDKARCIAGSVLELVSAYEHEGNN